ncbi:hypothetical protein M427DRAFT_146690 [Gonapodya prolifera JEL478]|uniref:Uncharacterized protein n=1 Tax=Gonapodya prolifera (strain JEL478) TaxID=1344416 RepID=A0A139A9C1_GONPJ|nr:hypothetical protein M427DRAFT_146690 [Gonapodya prolifera JEL478]|eukprot:KXS13284.1 hypothetical protein M427DRAFT_146690 [Gonapodya prolifera JEL478]
MDSKSGDNPRAPPTITGSSELLEELSPGLMNESITAEHVHLKSGNGGARARSEMEVKGMAKRSHLEHTLFSVLNSMVSGNEVPSSLAYPLTIFEDVQLLYFCWYPGYSFPGMPPWLPYIWNVFAYRPDSYGTFLILLGVAVSIVVTLVATIVFSGISFSRGKFKYMWPLTLLRAGTMLAVGALNIPITEVLITVLDCDGGFVNTYPSVASFASTQHILPFVVSVLCLVLFIPYTLTMALVYVDANPKSSTNPLTRAHGRTDLMYLVVKLIAVFLWEFSNSSTVNLAILAVCLLSIISLVADVFDVADSNNTIPFICLCVVLVPGFLLGALANRLARQSITRRVYIRLQAHIAKMRASTGIASFANVDRKAMNEARRLTIEDANPDTLLDQVGKNVMLLTTQKLKEEPPIFESTYDVELSCRFIRNAADPNALVLMRELFEAAFLQFPKDGFVHISAAQYLLAFPFETTLVVHPVETNAEKAEHILINISNMAVAFDIRFMGFVCEKTIEQTQKSREMQKSELNISSFVEILSQEKYAKGYNVLRLFADFNRTVLADVEEARRLQSLAEDLEGNFDDNTSEVSERKIPTKRKIAPWFRGQSMT